MSNYLVTDADLTAIANAIRSRSGTYAQLEYPNGFIDAINNICDLPVAYQQVKYIESTGTQYIDTGFNSTSVYSIDLEFEMTDLSTEIQALVGAAKTSSSQRRSVIMYRLVDENPCTRYLYTLSSTPKYITASYISDINKVSLSVNGSQFSFTTNGNTVTESCNSYTSDLSFYLFTYNHQEYGAYYLASMKLYKAVFTINDQVVRNFIPCYRIADNEIGLYDIANAQFYTNSGTGTFLKGPDV